jgi:hypothetical protein
MECRRVRPQALYQFLDPVNRGLVGDAGRQAPVMLDLAVDLDAPITHCNSAFARGGPSVAVPNKTTKRLICSFNELGRL